MIVRKSFEQELERIRNYIKQMGETTLAFVEASLSCLVAFDMAAAKDIRHYESEIDRMYREIDEKCVAIIATQQPTAGDLRFLIASIKIAAEIERIADYANNIAKRVQKKLPGEELVQYDTLCSMVKVMGNQAASMLKEALLAYVEGDANRVDNIVSQDEAVDQLNRTLLSEIINTVAPSSKSQQAVLELHTAIRYIERVADRATNIGEVVFYMSTGFPYVKKS